VILLLHTCRRLLAALVAADPLGHAAVLADLEQVALFGASDELKEYRLTAEQRRSRIAITAVAAAQCADRVRRYRTACAFTAKQ